MYMYQPRGLDYSIRAFIIVSALIINLAHTQHRYFKMEYTYYVLECGVLGATAGAAKTRGRLSIGGARKLPSKASQTWLLLY